MTRTFAERVVEVAAGPCRLYVLPMPVEQVVTLRGSFRTWPDFAAGETLLQRLSVAMLDRGTRRRDRFELARLLEDRGAHLSFTSKGSRVEFAGRMLRRHLADVLPLLAEQLREPRFDPEEFEKARLHVQAQLQQQLEQTSARARIALSQRLYPPAHPNYRRDPEAELERLATLTLEDVRAYHAAHFGANELILVLVGNVQPEAAEPLVREAFADWPPHAATPRFAADAAPQPPDRVQIHVPDRQNLDVLMGHAVPLRRQHPDYIPLYVGTYILGGNFSARLMATVRDEQGLTYGIHAALEGISTEHDGHFEIEVTLSQERLEEGIAATLAQVRRFVEEGVTEEELAEKKDTLTGLFQTGLSTTAGLATALLINIERGFGPGYLDRYPEEIRAVTRPQVNEVVQRYLNPEALHTVVAGSVETVPSGS
ncbi:M16 family metallopeptidase [Rhodothermus marinus]|uniref:M16 family metallopeptidase n=1 Tax=Rhodothermus marinus TaxID=29549 RepID=UPI0012BA4123|nr:pitrilysin family protein [Rhodothermus marinus]BBM69658.1 peptidase M16 [Rhodothermus marinus]BBM72640.1 peptidase M16 [Rhodothermus marinus]